jgi:hypothetical protein
VEIFRVKRNLFETPAQNQVFRSSIGSLYQLEALGSVNLGHKTNYFQSIPLFSQRLEMWQKALESVNLGPKIALFPDTFFRTKGEI